MRRGMGQAVAHEQWVDVAKVSDGTFTVSRCARNKYVMVRRLALEYDMHNCLDTTALRMIGFNVLNVGK